MERCQIPLDYAAEKWHSGNYSYNTVSVLVANKVLFSAVIGESESCSWAVKIFTQFEFAIYILLFILLLKWCLIVCLLF